MSWLSSLFSRRLPRGERKKLGRLESRLNYSFRHPVLLKRALTHKSYVNENRLSPVEQNERYEFLGDAVLELATSNFLMDHFPDASEGDLSKLRAAIVNEVSLAELARRTDLGSFLYLGRGENQSQGREKDSLLSDAYEAVLGAIYLDAGFETAYRVVRRQFEHLIQQATKEDILRDYKTRLQEVSQEKFRSIPRYKLVSEVGPDHDKTFEVHLLIAETLYGRGEGKSKKEAEQNAAKEALERLES